MLSPNVIGTVYSSNLFTYNKNLNAFIGDISVVPEVLRQLRADDFNTGFVMQSEKTGSFALFIISHIVRDDEEIVSWDFGPSDETIENFPALRFCSVRIFNT
jgi:hypothetical protein